MERRGPLHRRCNRDIPEAKVVREDEDDGARLRRQQHQGQQQGGGHRRQQHRLISVEEDGALFCRAPRVVVDAEEESWPRRGWEMGDGVISSMNAKQGGCVVLCLAAKYTFEI